MATARARLWLSRVGWLLLLWLLGVASVGAVAMLIRWAMRSAGMTT